tara:strand:- start:194 stop:400 length:207 start_codon:yes stop_codon:yes gene_type:complete
VPVAGETDMTATQLPRYSSDVQLAELFNVSRATIWRWAASGILPQPVKLSPGCTRWRLDQIQQLQGGA